MNEYRVYRGVTAPELRSLDGGQVLVGYAAVFNRFSQNLGGYVEQVDPVAFNDALARGVNVAGLGNHDPNWLLGTIASGTLALNADGEGLGYAMNLDAADPDAVRAARKAETGKFRGSSFSFTVLPDGESWSTTDSGFPMRTLRSVELYDVGPVTFPAYKATEDDHLAVALRSLAESRNEPVDRLVAAAHDGDLSKFIAGGSPVNLHSDEVAEKHSRSFAVRRFAAPSRVD